MLSSHVAADPHPHPGSTRTAPSPDIPFRNTALEELERWASSVDHRLPDLSRPDPTMSATLPPPNDGCSDAITLACAEEVVGCTTFATLSPMELAVDPCGPPIEAPAVWYTFVGTGNDSVISLCGSTYDTVLHIFETSTSCDELVCIVGNDDFCGVQSRVSFPTTEGTTYYVLVSGFEGATGEYLITYDCFDCAPGAPTGACCLDGFCRVLCQQYCDIIGGEYLGHGTTCDGGFAGLNAQGEWTLNVSDNAGGDLTLFSDWTLTINDQLHFSRNRADPFVPDEFPPGVTDLISVPTDVTIDTIAITVELASTWVGDVRVVLRGPDGTTATLLDRPGFPASPPFGDSSDLGNGVGFTAPYEFADDATMDIPSEASMIGQNAIVPPGRYRATDLFDNLVALDAPVQVRCPTACSCDFNTTAGVDITDLLAFLSKWFAQSGSPPPGGPGGGADFNADNHVDISDLLGFLACWFQATSVQGCS